MASYIFLEYYPKDGSHAMQPTTLQITLRVLIYLLHLNYWALLFA